MNRSGDAPSDKFNSYLLGKAIHVANCLKPLTQFFEPKHSSFPFRVSNFAMSMM
jgi:hypothetical protein